ncbi:MAG: hypothetical protein AMXMBFR34_07310 [Myxococcaceae bacterium]
MSDTEATATAPTNAPGAKNVVHAGLGMFGWAYRVELLLFLCAFCLFAAFSSQRFLRQSAAPHFVYQAKAWLDGRSDIDPEVLPNIEDWACVREVNGVKSRCEGALRPGDRWYSSFPWFPAVVMLPFVLVNGYQLNDTSFGVIIAALALALFYALLRLLSELESSRRSPRENAALAALLGFGTLFFYAAIRGEVWFSAEVMGVALTALYLRNAVGARRPELAGLFWSMAVLTRTPLFFTGIFFALEVLVPTRGKRAEEWSAFLKAPKEKLRVLGRFALGAAPLGLLAVAYNQARFGSLTEFGHRFLYNNRVNVDIDTWGLFHPHYLTRNLDAAFLKLPLFHGAPLTLSYDAWGLSLFLTLPLLALAVVPAATPRRAWTALAAMGGVLLVSALFPALPPPAGEPPIGWRAPAAWLVLALALGTLVHFAREWVKAPDAPRLTFPLLITLACCMVPGLLYQNTGYAQFGFRFSIDYTPYVVLLVALSGWGLKKPLPLALAALSLVVNFWGAVAFRGYTELVRRWN